MKLNVTIEDDRTGVQSHLTVDVPPTSSVSVAVAQQLGEHSGWNLLDVMPHTEKDPNPAPDPDFPDRPTHPDFGRLSAAVRAVDASVEGKNEHVSPPDAIGIDADSLRYLLRNRLGRPEIVMASHLFGLEVAQQAAWVDGFAVGIHYQTRGGSRPAETGNTGEEEGSL